MRFRISSKLQYKVNDLSTFIFNISASKNPYQTVMEESLNVEPFLTAEEIYSHRGMNRSLRFETNPVQNLAVNYTAVVDQQYRLIPADLLNSIPISQLPGDVLPYLFPSRYCQSDKLLRLASKKFGEIVKAYDSVYAICNWIKNSVEYVSGSTNSETSAFDTVTQRVGVCRDFAHLGIALCRALGIPARYFSCYAFSLEPPDFHACFEAYLGGYWIAFDPSQLAPVNGLIRIATGRDAADVSVATIYGNVEYITLEASSEVLEEHFQPLYFEDIKEQGVCF